MEMFLGGLAAGLIVGGVATYLLLIAKVGGMKAHALGVKVATKAASDPAFNTRVEQLFLPPPPPKPSAEPIRLIGILQRESRLLDFLMENVIAYTDEQIGASVRDIHAKAQAAIKKHISLEPVLKQEEGTLVTVQEGFDPSAIRLVGNVTGQPPFKGTLQHSGWRVKSIDIPKVSNDVDEFILMPAEVELA